MRTHPGITDDLEPAPVAGCREVIAWNIRHGGGPNRMPEIALELLRLRPHAVALLEWRPSVGGQIAGVLADHGLTHQLSTDPPPRTNGILLASRSPLVPEPPPRRTTPARTHDTRNQPLSPYRWLGAYDRGLEASITAVHVPCDHASPEGRAFWRAVTILGRAARHHPVLLIGDFNVDRSRSDRNTAPGRKSLGMLTSLGFTDAWRASNPVGHDPTWAGSGFDREFQGRLDHAWVSPPLAPRFRGARHIHRGRRLGASDHSAIGVSIAPKTAVFWGPELFGAQKSLEK